MKLKVFFIKDILLKLALLGLILFFLFTGGLVIWSMSLPIPDFNAFFEERIISQSTKIYDRTGEHLLYNVHENIKRTIIQPKEITDYIKQATIAIEDADFYSHRGVRPISIIRAFFVNIGAGSVKQGGSTLTQQVVKNSLLTKDRKISRKIKELILSLKIEQVMEKDDILAIYLNESPYGGNIYGVEEAAKTFFNKKASEVTLAEAAYLAALPQAPSYLSPYGPNRDKLDNRKDIVLRRMWELDFITESEFNEAKEQEIIFKKPDNYGLKAPHFVFYIIDYLEKKYGSDVVRNGGLEVITTLDWKLQQKAEEIIKKHGEINTTNFNADNAGMVVIDPKTGQILVMVGSRDYFDTDNDGNFNVTLAKRQPGSAFKPFVYATAFNKGYTDQTVVFDLPTEFNTGCSPQGTPLRSGVTCYSPRNYDGNFVGPITFRDALAQSRNIPAVKALYLAGIDDSIKTARSMGITTLTDSRRYGLTLVLGGGEVTLLEMTGAFGVFANDGISNQTTGIIEIKDNENKILEEYKKTNKQVLPPNTARLISSILSDNQARTPVFGENSNLKIDGYEVAVKTGTTDNFKDAWIVGYTPGIVVGAWVGNNDNTPMVPMASAIISAPLWNEFMRYYLYGKPLEYFSKPNEINKDLKPVFRGYWQGSQNYFIDSISKKLATEYTPNELREEKIITKVHSILHWVDKSNPLGPIPENPEIDLQYRLWEPPVRNWAASLGIVDQSLDLIPQIFDDVHTAEKRPKVKIINLNESYNPTDKVNIKLSISSDYQIKQANFFINGIYLGNNKKQPFDFTIDLSKIENLSTENELQVVVYDSVKNMGEIKTYLMVDF